MSLLLFLAFLFGCLSLRRCSLAGIVDFFFWFAVGDFRLVSSACLD